MNGRNLETRRNSLTASSLLVSRRSCMVCIHGCRQEAFVCRADCLARGYIRAKLCAACLSAHPQLHLRARSSRSIFLSSITQNAEISENALLGSEHLAIVYDGTAGACKARELLVDAYVARADAENVRGGGGRSTYPVVFWEISRRVYSRVRRVC
jgi:hypothetical protein